MREADVFGGKRRILRVTLAAELPLLRGNRGWTFAVNLPRARGVDGLAVNLEPRANAGDSRHLVFVNRPVVAHRHAQHQVSVLADDVCQHRHDGGGSFVLVLLEDLAVVVPLADAGVRLPRERENGLGFAALDVIKHGSALEFIELFEIYHRLVAAMLVNARVVKMRHQIKAILVGDSVEG